VELLKKTRQQCGGKVVLSSLLADLPRTWNTPEIRFACPDTLKFRVVDHIRDLYSRPETISLPVREVITVDGVRAVFQKGWGLIRASNTTPESLDLQRILREMVNEGISHVIMEVSSHGLDLDRVFGCQFDHAIFTNFTLDHLDYHKTLAHYFESKEEIPEGWKRERNRYEGL
jgi:hypothetical protein